MRKYKTNVDGVEVKYWYGEIYLPMMLQKLTVEITEPHATKEYSVTEEAKKSGIVKKIIERDVRKYLNK